jgi:hypothetical protein
LVRTPKQRQTPYPLLRMLRLIPIAAERLPSSTVVNLLLRSISFSFIINGFRKVFLHFLANC